MAISEQFILQELLKAAKGLSANSERRAALEGFSAFWGLDAYEPPESVMADVHQIVRAFLMLARSPKPEAPRHD